MKLFCALHSEAGTFHCSAAAATRHPARGRARLAKVFRELRIVRLPTEAMSPQARLRFTLAFAEAYSTFTRFQSHSSSSATSIGAEVMLPCPISERGVADDDRVVGTHHYPGGELDPGVRLLRKDARGPQPIVTAGRRSRRIA